MAGFTDSVEQAGPRRSRVVARRTVVAVAVVAILCVPWAVLSVISGQGYAASWALAGGTPP